MEKHIHSSELEALIEEFMHENPMGDTRELAEYMYNKGFENGVSSTCNLF